MSRVFTHCHFACLYQGHHKIQESNSILRYKGRYSMANAYASASALPETGYLANQKLADFLGQPVVSDTGDRTLVSKEEVTIKVMAHIKLHNCLDPEDSTMFLPDSVLEDLYGAMWQQVGCIWGHLWNWHLLSVHPFPEREHKDNLGNIFHARVRREKSWSEKGAYEGRSGVPT